MEPIVKSVLNQAPRRGSEADPLPTTPPAFWPAPEIALRRLSRTQLVAKPREEVFAFFSDPSNLEALTPRFLRFRILTLMPIEMCAGAQLDYELSLFGVPVRWRTRITDWQPGRRFVDEQESGPYAVWRHTHEFETRGTSTLIRDVVDYVEPLGPLGTVAHVLFVRRALDRIFDFRQDAIRRLLERGEGDFDIQSHPMPADWK